MKKKAILLSVCVAILLIFGVAYMIVSNQNQKNQDFDTESETETPNYTLTNSNRDELTKLHLKGEDYDITLLLNDNGIWVSEEHPNFPIKQSAVSTVMTYISSLSSENMVTENAEDLSEYGLSPARVTVTGYFGDNTTETLLVGEMTPGNDFYYITTPESNAVYMVSVYIGGVLGRNYRDFADTTLPEINLVNMVYFYFDNGRTIIEANYVPNEDDEDSDSISFYASNMILTTPIPGKSLYLDNVNTALFEPLANVKFTDIVELFNDNDEKYGFSEPQLQLLSLGANVNEEGIESIYSIHLTVGNDIEDETGYVYALFGELPCVFKVEKESLKDLFMANPYRLMDRFVAILYINDVDSVSIKIGDEIHDIQINNYKSYSSDEDTEGRDMIAPVIDGIAVNDEAFRKFYAALIGMTIDSEIEGFVPTGDPEIVITYSLLSDDSENITKFYDYNANFYAIEQNGGIHFVINKDYVNRTLGYIQDLKDGRDSLS